MNPSPLEYLRREATNASGGNKSTKYVTLPRESDLRQVGLRRLICPQICILQLGQGQSADLLTDSLKVILSLPITYTSYGAD